MKSLFTLVPYYWISTFQKNKLKKVTYIFYNVEATSYIESIIFLFPSLASVEDVVQDLLVSGCLFVRLRRLVGLRVDALVLALLLCKSVVHGRRP